MSGETTNYLGIICAVAGLFFFVVIASICMSCIKYCRKQLAKKRASAPPSNVPNGTSLRRPKERNKTSPSRRESYNDPSTIGSKKSSKASRNRNKFLLDIHHGGLSLEEESPSISVPDLTSALGPMPDSILKKTSQYCSFESFKSVSSAGGGWITPEQDSNGFNTYTYTLRQRQRTSVSRNDVTRDAITRVIGKMESCHQDGYMHETIIYRMPLGLRSYDIWFVSNWDQTEGKKASIHVCMYIFAKN
eukprot:sb/3468846/